MLATLVDIIRTYEKEVKRYITLHFSANPNDLAFGFGKLYPGKGHFVSLARENPNTIIVDGQFRCVWIDNDVDFETLFHEIRATELPVHVFGSGSVRMPEDLGPERMNYGFPVKMVFVAHVAIEYLRGHGVIEVVLVRDIRQPSRVSQTFEIE
ncbi:hypothetical protein 2050HW_00180 [Serratia phage vB_SmaM_ 2050HW]|uniref:Uncharacterized protein n=2 Tax=Moabitevirus TaxID=2843422 RepID=A0A7T3TM38_9CAUD|nr:hypothetical protein HWB23_gp180 [Serratia phage vB_SmaM_ 2050HW]QPX76902.1 hypothetical protein [Serratia phage vB_SmaM_Yaphecito]UCR74774.1 hypothetical protein [Serratia phage BUCT660]UQT03643.1 hypothetical protein KODAMA_01760 [Serratia phage vB_SmaM-Kodama]URG14036.1 hypothetical protein [Pectobacterium phage vB_ParM-25]ATA65515.1 hypothetical protein 2050HW_00180 [Serratia phage vB_SmaM_ 2050HW]